METLSVFVASSSEQLDAARSVASLLEQVTQGDPMFRIKAYAWTEQTFSFSSTYIESLEQELERADFAVVIMSADDLARVRRKAVNLPRDNVIFELGLFIGRIGRERSFFFVDKNSGTHLASDLTGVKEVAFNPGLSDVGPDTLRSCCEKVVAQMRCLGLRYKPTAATRAEQQSAWLAARQIAGYWWSLRYWDRGRVGLVTLRMEDFGPTLHVSGRAFCPDTPNLANAQWASIASTFRRDHHRWVLHFIWKGDFPSEPNRKYEGSSRYEFPADVTHPSNGSGRLLEASLKDLSETAEKAIELVRCSETDEAIMQGNDKIEKVRIVRERLASWPAP